MFMLANVFDIYEIDDDDDELKPLQPKEKETPAEAQPEEEAEKSWKPKEKTPATLVRDLYISGVGK